MEAREIIAALHRELELYTKAGMTPAEALRAGTLLPEEYFGHADELGTIDRGVVPAPIVDLLDEEPLEVEIATTLLYEHSHFSYRQIRQAVQVAGERRRREIIDLGLKHRGKHDETLRAFQAGASLRFDILMDIGGFRDMHRHRRCVQILQGFTSAHGYAIPEGVPEAGIQALYEDAIQAAHSACATPAPAPMLITWRVPIARSAAAQVGKLSKANANFRPPLLACRNSPHVRPQPPVPA